LESSLDEFLVGNQKLDNAGPCLVQRFIPNASRKVFFDINFFPLCDFSNFSLLFLYLLFSLLIRHFVDLMDEHKDVGVLIELLYTF
jgi:hypothetical protein